MGAGQDVITKTRTVKDALLTDVNDDMAELHLIRTEVIAARDGAVSLLAQIDALQASILAVTNGSGLLVSANDVAPGYLNGKLLGDDDILLTEGNDGGNDTLTASLKNSKQIADLESIAFFNGVK